MYSKHHALLSIPVAAVLATVTSPVTVFGIDVPTLVVVAYGTAIGVLIDLDHFLIARLETGTWDAVRFCLANPTAAVTDQRQIFDRGDVGILSRLLSHLLIIGPAVALLALSSRPLAIVTAGVLYVHLVSDIAWDLWRLEREAKGSRGELVREFG